MSDDLDRVLGEMEKGIRCLAIELPEAVYNDATPQLFRLITLARAAAIGHGGGHNNMRCPICTALRALTETNQQEK